VALFKSNKQIKKDNEKKDKEAAEKEEKAKADLHPDVKAELEKQLKAADAETPEPSQMEKEAEAKPVAFVNINQDAQDGKDADGLPTPVPVSTPDMNDAGKVLHNGTVETEITDSPQMTAVNVNPEEAANHINKFTCPDCGLRVKVYNRPDAVRCDQCEVKFQTKVAKAAEKKIKLNQTKSKEKK